MKGKEDRNKKTDLVDQIKKSARKNLQEKKENCLSTGITSFDLALGGGIPTGKIINLVGDSSSGKTFLASEIIFASKEKIGKNLKWFYDDVENRFSFNTKKLYGFDIIKKNQHNSYTIEDVEKNIKKELNKITDKEILIYVVDSFDNLTSEAELKREDKDTKTGTYNLEKQKALGSFFRLRSKEIKEKNCILIIISQVRVNIGAMFGAKYYRTGGKALDHMSSVIVWLAETEKLKKRNLIYGITTKAKITKVGNEKPFRMCFIRILFDRGVDDTAGNILYLYDLLTEKGKEKEKLNKEILEWEEKEFSFQELIDHIEKNNLELKLQEAVIQKWNDLEEIISSKNRKSRW